MTELSIFLDSDLLIKALRGRGFYMWQRATFPNLSRGLSYRGTGSPGSTGRQIDGRWATHPLFLQTISIEDVTIPGGAGPARPTDHDDSFFSQSYIIYISDRGLA